MSKWSRSKGLAFEREIANRLRVVFPGARRKLENHREDAAAGTDLLNTGRYKVQCKKLRDYAPIARIFEVDADQALGDVPVLVTAGDHKQVMAVLPFDELVRLIRESERRG